MVGVVVGGYGWLRRCAVTGNSSITTSKVDHTNVKAVCAGGLKIVKLE